MILQTCEAKWTKICSKISHFLKSWIESSFADLETISKRKAYAPYFFLHIISIVKKDYLPTLSDSDSID